MEFNMKTKVQSRPTPTHSFFALLSVFGLLVELLQLDSTLQSIFQMGKKARLVIVNSQLP